MAERIVSPGVFTREKDLSFLPQGIGEIGAALIGSTVKGPAFVPYPVDSFQKFQQVFGGLTEDSYLPYTAQAYLEDAGTATIVRVLGQDGYTLENPIGLIISSSAGTKLAGVLHPTTGIISDTDVFDETTIADQFGSTDVSASSFTLTTSGSEATAAVFSASLNPTDSNYFTKSFGFSPRGAQDAYVFANFKTFQSESFATGEIPVVTLDVAKDIDYSKAYTEASTPWITSQKVGGNTTNLIKFHTLSHGNNTNYEFKIGIQDIKPAGSVPGSEYGSFTVVVRRVDQDKVIGSPFVGIVDSDIRPNLVESFQGVNLDPNSPNFIVRVIGDKYITVDANGKLSTNGDYPNNSENIRVEVTNAVKEEAIDASLVPFGFAALQNPFGTAFYLGDNNQDAGANFPSSTSPNSGSISLSDATTSINSRKFIVPFQGGFDGFKPNRIVSTAGDITAGNTQGYDCSSNTATGTIAFRKAINSVSNPDEFDINMLVIPGLIHRLHSAVTTFAKDMCEDRQDTFFIMDASAWADSISTATNAVQAFDSNYVASYYPWVKILNTDKNKPVWVPPSAVLPGVIAFNDQVAAEWFAPAGLNRGGLTSAIEAKTRLTRAERDALYEGRLNPIATFPGQGVTVFGQKTLQAKPSALDRINVRRLLIAVKKFIASSTRYLVFENNTAATRNRFLSIVNPYLESIQQRQGLYAFRVIMDDTNNTPDVIDRNIMVGEIFLQPAKTAEFIVLDFNVLPTGAAFPE